MSYVTTPCGAASLEDEYSHACASSLRVIMDEGPLCGCHNPGLSTARSRTAPSRGRSHFIIDHPSSPRLDERMRRRNEEDEVQRRDRAGCPYALFFFFFLHKLKKEWTIQKFKKQCHFMKI